VLDKKKRSCSGRKDLVRNRLSRARSWGKKKTSNFAGGILKGHLVGRATCRGRGVGWKIYVFLGRLKEEPHCLSGERVAEKVDRSAPRGKVQGEASEKDSRGEQRLFFKSCDHGSSEESQRSRSTYRSRHTYRGPVL